MYNYVFYRNTDITDEQFEDILTGDMDYGDVFGKVEHIQKYITKTSQHTCTTYIILQYNTVQCTTCTCTLYYSTIQYNVLYVHVHYITVQYNTVYYMYMYIILQYIRVQ